MTILTVLGLLATSFTALQTLDWKPDITNFLVIGLGVPLVAIIVISVSKNWLISFLAYGMLTMGIGIILGPTIALYKLPTVMNAVLATGGVTVVMSIVGICYPRSLDSWAAYLLAALIAVLFVRVGQNVMIGMGMSSAIWYMPIVEYAAAVLFSLCIVYDWNRALRIPRTMTNAVDSACALFLDVVNLFITMLRIMGGSGASKD